jgi:beta-glucosidase
MVTAAQNNGAGSQVVDDGYLRVGMCCKHFAVYDVEGGGGTKDRYTFNAEVGARDLWEYYLPAFKACAVEAKAAHVMCSYNALNGVPTCANEGLLTEILRNQWDWDGFVVSDYDAWFFMSNDADDYHSSHYVNHSDDAAAAGINAGLDQEGGGDGAISHMKEAIFKNKTTAAHVDEAFRRLFRARIRLGMLDPPSEVTPNQIYVPALDTLVNDTAHLAVAEKAARESICLYKNAPVASVSGGRLALPLDASTFQRAGALAVVGPQANISGYLFGNYAEQADEGNWGKSVVDAFAARVFTAFVAGCDGEIPVACVEHSSLSDASRISATAEAVVVVLGLAFNGHCEAPGGGPTIANDYCEREGTDRGVVELPRGQVEMVKALRVASGSKPLIGVLIHGGAIALGDEVLAALDAIVDAWQPGMFGAEAIAGAVFGDFSPAGRTAVTWYKSTSQLPPLGHMGLYPNKSAGTHGVTYRYYDVKAAGEVLFPFGFGLSYTTFAYSNLRLPARAHGACDVLELTVDVTNTGSVDSDEVVQAYLSQPDASVPAPQLRLVAFERVSVPAGTTRSVALTLEPRDRAVVADETGPSQAVYTASASQLLEAGRLEIFVGGGQPSYFKGGVRGVVQVQESRPLLECEQVAVVV